MCHTSNTKMKWLIYHPKWYSVNRDSWFPGKYFLGLKLHKTKILHNDAYPKFVI